MGMYFFKEKKKFELINYLYSKCNEATLAYRKSYWEKNKFGSNLQEGIEFLKGNLIRRDGSKLRTTLVCLVCLSLSPRGLGHRALG